MNYTDLEDELITAIQRCCPTEIDKEKALKYFANFTVNDMIEEALKE